VVTLFPRQRETRSKGRDVFCALRAGTIQRGLVVQLSQLRVTVVRSEKLGAEAGDSSGTQRKGKNEPLEAATK
jgi:hypothetical protein